VFHVRRVLALASTVLAGALVVPTATGVSTFPPPALIETPSTTFVVGPGGWTPEPQPPYVVGVHWRGFPDCGPACIPPSGVGLLPRSGVARRGDVVRISLFMPVTRVRGSGFGGGRLTVVDANSGRLTWEVRRKKSFTGILSIANPRGENVRYEIPLIVLRTR
jgi:hypothetical protein